MRRRFGRRGIGHSDQEPLKLIYCYHEMCYCKLTMPLQSKRTYTELPPCIPVRSLKPSNCEQHLGARIAPARRRAPSASRAATPWRSSTALLIEKEVLRCHLVPRNRFNFTRPNECCFSPRLAFSVIAFSSFPMRPFTRTGRSATFSSSPSVHPARSCPSSRCPSRR